MGHIKSWQPRRGWAGSHKLGVSKLDDEVSQKLFEVICAQHQINAATRAQHQINAATRAQDLVLIKINGPRPLL